MLCLASGNENIGYLSELAPNSEQEWERSSEYWSVVDLEFGSGLGWARVLPCPINGMLTLFLSRVATSKIHQRISINGEFLKSLKIVQWIVDSLIALREILLTKNLHCTSVH